MLVHTILKVEVEVEVEGVSLVLKITESTILRQYHIPHQPTHPTSVPIMLLLVAATVTLTLLHPILLDGPCQKVRQSVLIQALATKHLNITPVRLRRLIIDGLTDGLLSAQSHAYSHIPDMASLHDEDTDPELFHQAAQRLHYSQQQQLHRPQQDYSSQPPRPTPFDGYSNESPQPSHVNAPAGGYDANQYRPQQEYGSQPPYNAPPSVPSHNEEYHPPRPAHSNAPAGGYSQFDSAPLDTDDDKPLAQVAQQHQPQHHTGDHNAPAGGLSVGGGGDDKYSSHLAAHEQAYGWVYVSVLFAFFHINFRTLSGSHDGPMDSDSIGSAAAIQAIKMNAQQNESVQHPPAGASPKPPSAPSGNTPPAPSQEEEETDSATAAAPPSTGNPAQDKIVTATPS